MINYYQLKAVADRAILHLGGLQQRAGEVEGGWRERRCLAALENRNKHDNFFLKRLKPLLNTCFDSEFTASRKKATALTSAEKLEDPKQRRGMQQQSTDSALARGRSAQLPWHLPEAAQRAGLRQQAAHIQHREGIYATYPSTSESGSWDSLGGGKLPGFYYKYSPGTYLTPT